MASLAEVYPPRVAVASSPSSAGGGGGGQGRGGSGPRLRVGRSLEVHQGLVEDLLLAAEQIVRAQDVAWALLGGHQFGRFDGFGGGFQFLEARQFQIAFRSQAVGRFQAAEGGDRLQGLERGHRLQVLDRRQRRRIEFLEFHGLESGLRGNRRSGGGRRGQAIAGQQQHHLRLDGEDGGAAVAAGPADPEPHPPALQAIVGVAAGAVQRLDHGGLR